VWGPGYSELCLGQMTAVVCDSSALLLEGSANSQRLLGGSPNPNVDSALVGV
jgi:hypothetical protein